MQSGWTFKGVSEKYETIQDQYRNSKNKLPSLFLVKKLILQNKTNFDFEH